MKTILTLLSLLLLQLTITTNSPSQKHTPQNQHTHNYATPLAEDSVMICNSPNAYAYHIKWCAGLQKCTHEVKKITFREAQKLGFEKPCGFCF